MRKRIQRWWLCKMLDRHTFCPPSGTYSGGIVNLLHGMTCKRCGVAFEDVYNRSTR